MKRLLLLIALFPLLAHAQVKVKDLPSAGSVSDSDYTIADQSGTTRKATISQVRTQIQNNLATVATSGSAADLTGALNCARLPAMAGGDVTSSAGSCTLTIPSGTVTLTQQANLAALRIMGNNTGSAAAPIALTVAQVKTLLALSTSDISGLATIATSASASDLSAGTTAVARGGTGTASTLTGLVRGSASAMTAAELSGDCTTSGSNVVTCTKTSGVSFATSATTDTTNASNISSGTLAATRGGAGTISGALKGNGAGTVSQAACADLSNAAASCSTDTTSATNISSGSLADARLSANVPLLNAANIFTANQEISKTAPVHYWNQSGLGADLGLWGVDVTSGVFGIRTLTDAFGAGQNVFTATRGTTTALTNETFGYSVAGTYTFPFTGNATFSGGIVLPSTKTVQAGSFIPLSANVPGNGVYLPASNTVGFAANNSQVGTWNTTTLTILGALNAANLASSSTATTGTLCWTTGTGLVNVDTTTTCLLSSRKYKQAIQPLDTGLAELMELKPVSYELKPQYNPDHLGRQVGFIAEDVEKVDPRFVGRDPKTGNVRAVRYQQMVALLVKSIQEQQAEIVELKRQLSRH